MNSRSLSTALPRAVLFAAILLAGSLVAMFLYSSAFAQDAGPTNYAENGTGPVAVYTASDPEGLGIDWDVTGTDAAAFSIDAGVLSFKKSPDYEKPTDVVHTGGLDADPANEANNNEYVITVRATEVRPEGDESPAQSTTRRVVVTVTNENEDGTVTLSRLQPQASATGLTASLTDPDGRSDATLPVAETDITSGVTWQWSVPKVSRPDPKNDDHWQPAGAIQTTDASYTPDESDEGKYLRVKASYTDGEGAGKAAYAVSANKVRAEPTGNDDPVFPADGDYTRELPESTAVGANVGAPVQATDANSDTLTYVLTGANASLFAIDQASGQITVASALDYETDPSYEVTVTAYDPSNAMEARSVTITATDVNEKPAVAGAAEVRDHAEKNSVDETVPYAALEGLYTPSDVDVGDEIGDLKLSLEGDDAAAFELGEANNDGARVLTFKDAPNYEAPTDANGDNVYKVTVVATDDEGLTGEQAVTVIVMNIDEAGEVTLSSVQPQADVALTATLSDPDGGETGMEWQWASSQTSGGVFIDIDGATSASYTPAEDDPATKDVDEGDEGKFLRVTVTYNDAQALDDPNTADTDEGVDRTLMATSANAVREAPETNERPAFAATVEREVKENTAEGGNVGEPVRATDADNDVLTYSLSGGADKDSFEIDSASGQITVGAGTTLDYEAGPRSYAVEVMAADAFGESATVMVIIMVTNVDEPPAFEADDPEDYAENGTGPVATYVAEDPEELGIDWDVTGTDAAAFSIDAGVLSFKKSPDYEKPTDVVHTGGLDADPANEANNNEYVITVRATEVRPEGDESPAQSTTRRVVVTVTNENEDGTVTLSRLQPQASATGLTASLTDPDGRSDATLPVAETDITSGVTWQWSVPKVERPDPKNDDHWQPAGATQTTDASYTPDESDEGKYLRVKASYTDGEGAGKAAYAVSANKVRAEPTGNDDPVFPADGDYTRELPESTAVGANVGAPVQATDANSDTLTYVLTGANASLFAIDQASGQITVASALDYETDPSYEVTVTAYDPSNAMAARSVTITATDVNEKPAVAGAAEVRDHAEKNSVDETVPYAALEGLYTPSDVDVGDEIGDLKLSLEGDDAAAFELGEANNDGARVLTFKDAPNYEAPTDANRNNVYKVTVVATDDEGLTGEQAVTVIVMNIDEAGAVTLSSIQPQADVALTATLSDPDGGETGMEWQWASSQTSGGVFIDIDGATSASYTPAEDDPATKDVDEGDEGKFLRVTVTYNDAQALDDPNTADTDEGVDRTLMATSANAVREAPETNERPAFAATVEREVKENTAEGGNVGEPVKATDADNDVLTYSLSGGADKDSFEIDSASGQITVGAGTTLDYEAGPRSYAVEVMAADPFSESNTVMVTIMVTNVDEPPTLAHKALLLMGDSSVEYAENGTDAVATYTAVGPSLGDVEWSLSGDDAGDFSIEGGVLAFMESPDHDAPTDADMNNVYEITVTATKMQAEDYEGDPVAESLGVTITVTDVDENVAPEFASATTTRSVVESTAAGENIGAPVEATDANAGDTLAYTLGGADKDSFEIDSASGQITVGAGTTLDYEAGRRSYTVDVTATDDAGASDTVTVTITVTDVDENVAPEFASATTTRSVVENTAAGENIGAPVEATDANAGDTLAYTLGGADKDSFEIDDETGQITVGAGTTLDYEAGRRSYTVDVTATDDAGASDTVTVTITVTDVDENVAPEFASATTTRSVVENTAAGENIGAPVEATDANAGDTLTYTLGGADKDSFEIDDETGQITVGAGTTLDYEAGRRSYTVDVTATDDAGASDTVTVTITVTDVDEETGPMTLLDLYDTDDSGAIDRDEVIGAINAYLFDDAITRDQVIKVINLYLFG